MNLRENNFLKKISKKLIFPIPLSVCESVCMHICVCAHIRVCGGQKNFVFSLSTI